MSAMDVSQSGLVGHAILAQYWPHSPGLYFVYDPKVMTATRYSLLCRQLCHQLSANRNAYYYQLRRMHLMYGRVFGPVQVFCTAMVTRSVY
jgi:hypothetical protein